MEMLNNQPTFKQGTMCFTCKKLYRGKIEPEGFIDKDLDIKNYPNHDYHYIYIGEIEEVYGEENARSIMSGFLTNISFRVNDAKSREYIQGLYGKNRKKEIFVSAVQGKGVTEQITDGNVVEDWDISKLRIGEAVIGLPGMSPFTFQFQEY